jgi:hypothetical protein
MKQGFSKLTVTSKNSGYYVKQGSSCTDEISQQTKNIQESLFYVVTGSTVLYLLDDYVL